MRAWRVLVRFSLLEGKGRAAVAAAVSATAAMVVGCGSAENRPARWSYIQPAIIQPSCATASCHSATAARAGVVLDTPANAWQSLVARNFVVPYNSGDSALLHLMGADGVRRMPPDFALPDADIQLIAAWIDQGAMNN
jgi:Planctomycete cytochrome C